MIQPDNSNPERPTLHAGKPAAGQLNAQDVHLQLALTAGEIVTWDWDIAAGAIRYSANVTTLAHGEAVAPYSSVDNLLKEVHAEDRERLVEAIRRTVQERRPFECEYRVHMLDGAYHWILARGKIMAEEGDQAVRVLGISQDITERKEAERQIRQLNEMLEKRVQERTVLLEAAHAALLQSKEHLHLALEGAHVGTWSWEMNTNRVRWDERIYAIYGFDPHQSPSFEAWLARVHPDDREPVLNQFKPLLAPGAGDSWEGEFRIRHPAKGLRWLKGMGRVGRDAEGRALRFTGVNFDITDRQQAEEAVRESEAKYRTLYQTMTDAVASVDLQGRFLQCNRAYEEMVGYSQEELRRLTYMDLTPEKWHAMEARIVAEQVLLKGSSELFEKECRHKNGTVFPVEVRAFLTRDEAGQPFASWAIIRDITERKRAQQEIRRLNECLEARVRERTAQWEAANDQLRHNQALLRAVTDHSPDPIFLKDRQGRVIFANPAAAATIGKSPEAMLGKTAPEYLSDPVLGRTMLEQERRVMDIGVVEVIEQTILTPAGLRVFLTSRAPHLDADGKIIGLVGVARDITKRKQTEDQLRKLSRAVEQSPVSVVITDPQGNIEYVNPKFTAVTGYRLDEVRGRNPRILKSGELPPEVYARLWQTITSGAEWRGEFHNKRKNGELFWEAASISPVQDEKTGRVTHFVAIKEDITGRKRAEEQLRASEARYRAVVEDQTEAICRFRPDGTLLFGNKVFCQLLGQSDRELLGTRWDQWLLPEDALQIEAKLSALGPANPIGVVEKRVTSANGQVRWMQFVNRGFFDAQGRLVEVQAVGRDITERKQAEEKLRMSEARYRAVVEDQTELICRISTDGTLLFVNEVFCRVLGKPAEKLTGNRWQPMALTEDVSHVEERLGTLCPAHPIVVIENRVVDGQGRVRWMQFINRGIFDAQGRLVEVQAVGRDITDRREAEEEIRRLNETLEKRVQERTVLLEAANLALQLSEAELEKQVEMRTAELQSANAALEQRSRQLAQLAADLTTTEHRERRRLADLLHDHPQQLLVAARMQVDDLRKREELRNLTQLDILQRAVNEALTSIRTLTTNLAPPVFLQKEMATALQWLALDMRRHHQLAITLSIGEGVDSLTEAMSVLLFTAARELLLNVVKHAGTREASLRLRRSARSIELKVKDKGRGMDQDARQTLLVHPGFGLFGIRERVGLLGGRLTLNSVPGRGTCVTLLFPVDAPAPAAAARGGAAGRTPRRRKTA